MNDFETFYHGVFKVISFFIDRSKRIFSTQKEIIVLEIFDYFCATKMCKDMQMNLNDYKKAILASSIGDWTSIGCWGTGAGPSFRDAIHESSIAGVSSAHVESHSNILSLKADLNIQIAHGLTCQENYVASWTENFTDQDASSYFVDFFYANQLIYRDKYISVDGGRCLLPSPSGGAVKGSLEVAKDKYEFYQIFNDFHDYDDYMREAGFIITDQSWME